MARHIPSQKRFAGGIADYAKESANGQIADAYYFGRAINYRDDPQSLTLLPAAVKESGSQVTDLLKWGELVPVTLTSYFYGNSGNFYSRTSGGTWTNLHTVPSSHGNGLAYFSGDDYVYYTQDASFGRYGPTQSSPTFTDDYLKSQGGVPQNTASLLLASASSMYATAADSASLSVTGDLTLETYFKANSLPTSGNSMTLIGKWDESTNSRSYKLDLYGVSGFFGDGSDGSLTISSNTTDAPIDSSASGTAGTQSLTATNASFAAGQIILIHQTRGTNAGQWERNTIQSYTAGTITLATPLIGSYAGAAQVIVCKRYSSITVNSGVIWSAKAWNGTVGGILPHLCSGTIAVNGTVSAGLLGPGEGYSTNNQGFRGGSVNTGQGEGTAGAGDTVSTGSNGSGGGGGNSNVNGAGGGGHATAGTNGTGATPGQGGTSSGAMDLTTMTFGGGGGRGATASGQGGYGGGIVFLCGVTITVNASTGYIKCNGSDGQVGSTPQGSGGGGGAGGSILLKCQTATLGTNRVLAQGGVGGTTGDGLGNGGAGANGRITINYLTSYTGTTTPTLTAIQDNSLVTSTTIQSRLGISNDGTAFEYLTQNLPTLTTGAWNRLSVAWTASTSTASFYLNAVLIGTAVGTKTAIHDNASLLYVAANKTSVVANFFDGLLNDVRIWGNVQTATQIYTNNNIQINANSTGLKAYYKLNSSANDATANANNLTLVNSPTYSTDVPFPAPSTRLDIDKQNTNTGQTYTLLTSISESATDKLSITPGTDPQSSVAFYVDTKGTGDWTVTVHDQQNRVVATKTLTAANIPTGGAVEFIFSSPWRIIAGKSYHMHLTVSTGTSKVVTGTTADFSTAEYTTYFGWLVSDTQFHPVVQFQYQPLGGTLTGALIIGNERYLAVWDGTNYSPNFIAFPPAWRVRCFGFWREYLAVGMWRGGNIYDFDRGRIYFWDGVSPTFNFFIDVPDGQINAMFGVDNDLYLFAGYRGELLDYQGGYFQTNGNTQSSKLKRMPLIQPTDYTEVYPGAICMWRGLLHMGLYGASNSTVMQRGVYSYGTLNQYYPNTLSYDYVISTGNRGSTVTIGCVVPIGQSLIVGWQDGIAYGADKVNFSNPPASSGELQLLIQDDGDIWKSSANFSVRADFLPLRAGESIDVKYSIDRAGFTPATTSTPDSTVGDTVTKLPISNGRGREYQVGVDLYATGTTSPTLLGISLWADNLKEEFDF